MKDAVILVKNKLSVQILNDCYGALIILNTLMNSISFSQSEVMGLFTNLLAELNRSGQYICDGIILELQKYVKGGDENSIIATTYMG